MKLLILNYSMNESSLVFSHQREIAKRLSERFEEVHVITADEEVGAEVLGISVSSTRWIPNKRITSVIKFYRVALPLILKNRKNLIVFSHMTEVQSFLLAPWCHILRIPHFLWYAHTSKSFFLYATYPLVNGIITSTPGSCPLKGRKVHAIGQAIDETNLRGNPSEIQFPPLRWYHVGRVDSSKNIDLIISVFRRLRAAGWNLKLDIYGAPSSEKSKSYMASLLSKYRCEVDSNWLSFKGSIKRKQLYSIANDHDGFVHAFQGSLDKTVLEATLCKRIVASINPEYMKEFSIENKNDTNLEDLLLAQISRTLSTAPDSITRAIESNYEICNSNHTLERWLVELCKVLKNEK